MRTSPTGKGDGSTGELFRAGRTQWHTGVEEKGKIRTTTKKNTIRDLRQEEEKGMGGGPTKSWKGSETESKTAVGRKKKLVLLIF